MEELNRYIKSKKILFAKVQDLPNYKDTFYDREIAKQEKNKKKFGGCGEICNFLILSDSNVYGFTQLKGTICIEKMTPNLKDKKINYLEDCLVIFVSDNSEVVGYYKNATIFREYQSNKLVKDYIFKTKVDDMVFFDKNNRVKVVQKGRFSLNYGQTFIKYVDDKNLEYVKELIDRIEDSNDTYQEIAHNYTLSTKEKKELKIHLGYEGRISQSDVKKIKKKFGYKCPVCEIEFEKHYGSIGKDFIELHHLNPYNELLENEEREVNESDFAILCSNCHRMIHRIKNLSYDITDIDKLKKLYKK